MRGLARLTTLATLVVALAGCGAPAPTATPSATAVEDEIEAGVVVVNRSQQPIAPAVGFVTPACGETLYDTATANVISDKMMAWAEGGVEDVAPPVGRLDVFLVPPRGRWFLLVTSTDDPQLFFQGQVPPDLLAQVPTAKPRPDAWPLCVGQAKLG